MLCITIESSTSFSTHLVHMGSKTKSSTSRTLCACTVQVQRMSLFHVWKAIDLPISEYTSMICVQNYQMYPRHVKQNIFDIAGTSWSGMGGPAPLPDIIFIGWGLDMTRLGRISIPAPITTMMYGRIMSYTRGIRHQIRWITRLNMQHLPPKKSSSEKEGRSYRKTTGTPSYYKNMPVTKLRNLKTTNMCVDRTSQT